MYHSFMFPDFFCSVTNVMSHSFMRFSAEIHSFMSPRHSGNYGVCGSGEGYWVLWRVRLWINQQAERGVPITVPAPVFLSDITAGLGVQIVELDKRARWYYEPGAVFF